MTSDIHKKLNQLRLTNTGCDVILQIGPKSFLAHRVVLMAQIEYFQKMLTVDLRERKELVIPLDPEIVDSTFFEEILNYIYTSKIDFTDENIRAIYKVADYLCFDKLTSEVIEHMKSNMDVENVVFYKTVAIEFGLKTLKDDCHQFIIRNLSSDIKREQLIPILLLEDLNEILQKLKQSGKLEKMFHYSIDWIVHHKHYSELLKLLKNIPLENLSSDFLKQVASQNNLIRKDIKCFNLLFDAFITVTESQEKETKEKNEVQVEKLNSAIKESDTKLEKVNRVHEKKIIAMKKESDFRAKQIKKAYTEKLREATKESDSRLKELNNLKATIKEYDSRLKEANKAHTEKLNAITKESESRLKEVKRLNAIINKPLSEILYAIGGKDGDRLASVSEYNSTTNKWTASTPMPSDRTHFDCAVIGHKIYVSGGHNGDSMDELTVFDTDTQKWTQLTPMKHARQLCAVAALNRQIYVAGGLDNGTKLTVVERYNIATDQWQDVASITIKRSELELVALNGFLYAICGHEGDDGLKIVERYDPQTNQWTVMSNTNNKYSSFGSAVLNGNIYIGDNYTCEVYSPADDKWTEMPAPRKCGKGGRLAAYNGKLYAIGGRVGEKKDYKGIKTVEVFDMQARVWRQEPDMDVARCFHRLAVVRD